MMCRKPAGDSGTGAAHCLWDLNVDQVGCTDILATRWQVHRVRQQRATRNGRRNAHRRGREHAVLRKSEWSPLATAEKKGRTKEKKSHG